MPAVSIVIPVFNALEYARQCLDSVYRSATEVKFEVIVVNNGSSPEVDSWLVSEMRRRANLTVLTFDHPLGFAGAANEGARKARHDFLVLLNSDAAVTDGWLDCLIETMERDPGIGIVSPVTNHSGPGPQLVSQPRRTGVIEEPRRLFFFCVMIRRELWDTALGLDEAYGLGTWEDDDFCLRARLAGWRIAVDPRAFVFNHASRTFRENQIDHDEWLLRNEKIFLEKANLLSRSAASAVTGKQSVVSTTVIVAVPEGEGHKLADSLCSLANQTVTGFETVVVLAEEMELPPNLAGLVVPDSINKGPGVLWNAGLAAAHGDYVCYLPAGDIFFPYHIEILHRALARERYQAICSGWSVSIHSSSGVRRAAVRTHECTADRLLMGSWAPLICWMHHRSCLPSGGFREDLRSFFDWDFALRLSRQQGVGFEPSLTCERVRSLEDKGESFADAESVMNAFPVSFLTPPRDRTEFHDAVRNGVWEEALIVGRQEREYRARRLFRRGMRTLTDEELLRQAARRVATVRASQKPTSEPRERVDFLFLNILRWSDLTQRPHHFAAGLARRGHRVFWCDVKLIRPEQFPGALVPRLLAENIFEIQLSGLTGDIYHAAVNPPLLELWTSAVSQLSHANGIEQAVQLINFPGWAPLARSLRRQFGWPILYDCLDDQFAFSELYGQSDVPALEGELTDTSDLLITSGHRLYEMKVARRKDAILIRNGVDFGVFNTAASKETELTRPVIGFFGAFADWLDLDWVEKAALRFPSWTFVYIGREGFAREENRLRWRTITSAPNVRVLPQMDIVALAAHLVHFDVCTMPFQDLPITQSMHAVKIYEYLAAGKHALVPALPEMMPFAEQGLLLTYRDHEESFALLEKLAIHPPARDQIMARKAFAERNDWSERVDRLVDAVRLFQESAA